MAGSFLFGRQADLPGLVDLRALYEAAAQNGLALPGIAQGWRAEVEAPALYWEYLRNLYGVQPAVPPLPERSGGGWEGSSELGDGALVPMFQDAVETRLEAESQREFAELQAVLGDGGVLGGPELRLYGLGEAAPPEAGDDVLIRTFFDGIKPGEINGLLNMLEQEAPQLHGAGDTIAPESESTGHTLEQWVDYSDSTIEKATASGIMRMTVTGHSTTPKRTTPLSIVDHVGKDGRIDVRTFYDKDGWKAKEIHTTDHGHPKEHPIVPHVHEYFWNENGDSVGRTMRDLTDQERKENEDIL